MSTSNEANAIEEETKGSTPNGVDKDFFSFSSEENHNGVSSPKTLDSETMVSYGDSVLIDNEPIDETTVPTVIDSTAAYSGSSALLDATVDYSATDSIVYGLIDKKIFLFNEGRIVYKDIDLSAGYIELNMDSSIVYARGLVDTSGVVVGKPIFKQGSDEFETDEIRYNFNTKKGIITGIVSEQQGGYVHSGRTKMMNDSTFCLVNGKYTTCDAEHPHFYLHMTKAKIVSKKTIVSGPAYLVVEDVPIYPAVIPFGFFPNSSKYSSGFLMPSYGEETKRGFFLRDMGYYWAASDYFDIAVRGDIYSRGSRGIKFNTNYKVRYKYSGSFNLQYYKNVYGEKGFTTGEDAYTESKDFSVTWSLRQDSKANPYQTFSASVDFSTSSFDTNNSNLASDYLTNTKSSSISYTKKWPTGPFSISSSLRHSQNSRDTTITLTLPQATVSMSRIYPFKRKLAAGEDRWYEKIGLSYTMDLQNKISTKEDELLSSSFIKDWKNGVKHSIPISTSMTALKYVTISPSFNYNERWYTNEIRKKINEETNSLEVTDTIYGFSRSYDYSMSVGASTKIYGMYDFINPNWKVKKMRHVMTPSISFSYRPDFSEDKFGMYGSVIDTLGVEKRYAYNEGSIYGASSSGKSGSIGFSLNNTLELKATNANDSTNTDKYKKISIFDQLSFSGSYNLAADSLNLSTISMRGRTTVGGINLNFGATFDPYAYDTEAGTRINTFEVSQTGKLARMTSANMSFGLDFSSKSGKKGKQNEDDADSDDPDAPKTEQEMQAIMEAEGKLIPGQMAEYANFDVPWNINMDYSFRYSKPRPNEDATINQTVDFSGDLNLTTKWKLGFSSSYDIQNQEITYTQFNIYRDLHCWQMSFNMVPFGYRQSYSFTIRASSSMLSDLKISKRQSWYDN